MSPEGRGKALASDNVYTVMLFVAFSAVLATALLPISM